MLIFKILILKSPKQKTFRPTFHILKKITDKLTFKGTLPLPRRQRSQYFHFIRRDASGPIFSFFGVILNIDDIFILTALYEPAQF